VEACDDANDSQTDACLNDCSSAECGDGLVFEDEEDCDDANGVQTDDCLNDCRDAQCGDGFIHEGIEACDDQNVIDDDDCANDCTLNCAGWVYDGICLMEARSNAGDNIPNGCNAYRPNKNWGEADYVAICNHFTNGVTCNNIDRDGDGGRCNNYSAVLIFETEGSGNATSPDVWVHQETFDWNPTNGNQQCNFPPNPPNSVVYACQ
jgi:cysteine-rich repeat protein